MISLVEKGLSYPDVSSHLGETLGIKISPEHVSTIVQSHVTSIQLAEPLAKNHRWYLYDEQNLKVNGRKVYRVTVYDAKDLSTLYEKDHGKFNKGVLRNILKTVFHDKKPKGFTFDMAPLYPGVFTEVFGKDLNIPWCLFHLNQLIFKEVQNYPRKGRKVYWTLEEVHQLYECMACFFVRDTTIEYIIECKQRLEQFKQFLKGKSAVPNRNSLIIDYEKQLVREVFNYQHQLKLMRKRNKESLRLRTKADAHEYLNKLLYLKLTFIKPIQKRILSIEKNFERFTTHLDVPEAEHTTNKLEGRYGVTLRKTEKIRFRSRKAVKIALKLKKLKNQGALF